jgi:hypothetical protein
MQDRRPLTALAALEQAQVQLELVLRPDAHWRALAQATLPAHRAALERALADNPVFHAWSLLGQAIAALRAESVESQAATAGAAAPPQIPARPPRIELRQVLQRIRVETPFHGAELPAGATTVAQDDGSAPPAAPLAIAPGDIEIEEAAVSFIVREPASGQAPEQPAVATRGLEASRPDAPAAPEAPPGAPTGDNEDDTETEVTIVPRRS